MSDNNKKNLANLIKADLKDALTNNSRWKSYGIFGDYFLIHDEIWIDTNNQKINQLVKENAHQNRSRREEQWKKENKEWERQGKRKYRDNFTLYDLSIHSDELEKIDYDEIVSLIDQVNKLWKEKAQQRQQEIEEKLNNISGLYYYGRSVNDHEKKSNSWFEYGDKRGGYLGFLGKENNKGHSLEINSNHPVLNNFSFQKGFYLIATDKPVERNDDFGRPWSDGGENNPSNFHKWVEVGDEITITPYNESKKKVDKPKKQENSSDESTTESINLNNEKIINFLIQYFQENNIKKIKLINGELIITHNNNETITPEQISSDSKVQELVNYCKKYNKQELTKEELINSNVSNSTNTKNNNNSQNKYLWLAGGITIGAIILTILVFSLRRKRQKVN